MRVLFLVYKLKLLLFLMYKIFIKICLKTDAICCLKTDDKAHLYTKPLFLVVILKIWIFLRYEICSTIILKTEANCYSTRDAALHGSVVSGHNKNWCIKLRYDIFIKICLKSEEIYICRQMTRSSLIWVCTIFSESYIM